MTTYSTLTRTHAVAILACIHHTIRTLNGHQMQSIYSTDAHKYGKWLSEKKIIKSLKVPNVLS